MMSVGKNLCAALFVATVFAAAQNAVNAAETTIRLGNTAPYSGPASAYGTIARALT